MLPVDDRAVSGVLAVVGAIPVAATLAAGAAFGAAATIGLGALALGLRGLLTGRGDWPIPPARTRRGHALRSARCDDR